MRVVCDNCGASYKIPESKLVKEVNKATCRKCGNAILIRRVTAPTKAAPSEVASPDERTQISSAADLERQARARPGGFEENAGAAAVAEAAHGEETVPRDEGPPQRRPAGASTDPGGGAAVPKPAPPSQPAAKAPAPKAPPAPKPARPVATPALAQATPSPAPLRPPAMRDGPSIQDERPAPLLPPVSALPPAQPQGAGKGDLLLTLVGVVVGFFGAAAVVAGAVLSTPLLGLVGVFLLLFCLMFMLVLLISGRFGQRPASKLGATAGGLFAGSLGAVAWLALWGIDGVTSAEAVAENTPAVKTVEPAPVAVVEPPPVEPVAAPVAVAEPVPVPAPVVEAKPAEPAKPLDPAAKAKAEEDARLKAEAKAAAKAQAEEDARLKAEAKAAAKAKAAEAADQARITPTPKTETTTTTTTTKAAGTSSGSSLSVQAVATMVNSNKSVKLCYLKEANRTGAVPHAKVKITVTPTGKATKATAVGEHAGTEFGNCLSGAITSITFPPFEGESTTITYAN